MDKNEKLVGVQDITHQVYEHLSDFFTTTKKVSVDNSYVINGLLFEFQETKCKNGEIVSFVYSCFDEDSVLVVLVDSEY